MNSIEEVVPPFAFTTPFMVVVVSPILEAATADAEGIPIGIKLRILP
jgi:hypothetical protein